MIVVLFWTFHVYGDYHSLLSFWPIRFNLSSREGICSTSLSELISRSSLIVLFFVLNVTPYQILNNSWEYECAAQSTYSGKLDLYKCKCLFQLCALDAYYIFSKWKVNLVSLISSDTETGAHLLSFSNLLSRHIYKQNIDIVPIWNYHANIIFISWDCNINCPTIIQCNSNNMC